MAYTYILLNLKKNKTYIGSTLDLEGRLKEHNSGKSVFTKRFGPWELFYKETYSDLKKARKREKYLKSGAGRKFIKRLFDNPR